MIGQGRVGGNLFLQMFGHLKKLFASLATNVDGSDISGSGELNSGPITLRRNTNTTPAV